MNGSRVNSCFCHDGRQMLGNLSPSERQTLVKLGARGPAAKLDHVALNKLFKFGLIEVDSDRRIVLTRAGRKIYDHLLRSGLKIAEDSGEIPVLR